MTHRPLRSLALASAAVLAGCAGTPVDRSILAQLRPLAAFPGVEPLGMSANAVGFDADDGDAPGFVVGDTTAFGVVLESSGTVQRWLVTIAVEAAIDDRIGTTTGLKADGGTVVIRSRPVHLAVTVADDTGRSLRASSTVTGDAYLSTGIRLAADLAAQNGWTEESPPGQLSDDEAYQLISSLMTLAALFQIVQNNDALSPILWEIVEVPSLFSMMTHLGVTVSASAEPEHAVFGTPAVLGSGPTCAIPVTVLANGSAALLCRLFATDPRPPYRLTAGVVAIEAVHPTDATRRFSMRMLAARRGGGGR